MTVSGPPHLDYGLSADVQLVNRVKSPDYSLIDSTPGLEKRLKGIPTIVFEVAFTESSHKLTEDCGRWVACSRAKVHMAIGLDIIKKKTQPTSKKEEIDSVWCSVWELVDADPLEAIPANKPLNQLFAVEGEERKLVTRGPKDLDPDPVKTPAAKLPSKFTCVSLFSPVQEQEDALGEHYANDDPPSYVRYHAAVTRQFQMQFFFVYRAYKLKEYKFIPALSYKKKKEKIEIKVGQLY